MLILIENWYQMKKQLSAYLRSFFGIWRMNHIYKHKQGIDGSERKPALRQDTGYMVEKTYYDIAQYLVAFGPI